jgi:F-type H+-transporting ATPase subunit a
MSGISLAPEHVISILGIRLTSTFLATILVDVVLILLVLIIRGKLRLMPGTLQLVSESVIEYFYDFTEQIAGKFVSTIFPWFLTFFIFIFFANILGIFPGFGSIGLFAGTKGSEKFIPLLRAGTSDLNLTLALAVISLVATHFLAIRYNGIWAYLGRFFSFNPMYLFVGLIELFSEFMKIVSFSFRLFGNIFAGKVVLHTISSFLPFLVPVPFLLMETIIALVQALVFSMLTMVFMSIFISPELQGGKH